MKNHIARAAAAACLLSGATSAQAHNGGDDSAQFERVATFVVCQNTSCDRSEVELTSAEIITASEDGKTLVYTDSPNNSLGFVDIKNPAKPKALGALKLEGEPTSVTVRGKYALAVINTSESLLNPSGYLGVFPLAACTANPPACTAEVKIPLAGQPDSIAVSPDGRYAAIVIENERDEEVEVNGVEGGLPQLPGGALQVLTLAGAPADWTLRTVDLTGLSAYAPEDPEPEFVNINSHNIAAVSLQENNHIALVHLPSAKVIKDFPGGEVNLQNVDADNEGVLDPVYSLDAVPREPDAVAWLGLYAFATANEGDLFGGSRGFSIFGANGQTLFDSGHDFEYVALAHGHYPEDRADNKGTEPEGAAFARYGRHEFLFVGSERGNFVAVYDAEDVKRPKFVQILPSGMGPEGLLPIPQRDLFVIASEEDDPVRSTISVYALKKGQASYPTVVSGLRKSGPLAYKAPIGWVALSALAGDRWNADRMYTVHDSYLKQSRIYKMDISDKPARITDEIVLKKAGATVDYDLEGLTQRANGGFWAVSEGSGSGTGGTPNLLIEVAPNGTVLKEIVLPDAVAALKKSNGYEGVAVTGSGNKEQVYLAFQREWTNDPAGLVRIGRYTPATGEWKFFYYPLDPVESPAATWVGLSEIVALSDTQMLVLERDNAAGPDARAKRLYKVSLAGVTPVAQGGTFPVLRKTLVRDLIPDLAAANGWLQEKVEGVGISANGGVYIVTDNDGVEDNTGETQFIRLGKRSKLGF
jgi:Esterase-like activity of phytase